MEGFKKKFKETPVIWVEAGNFTYDSAGYPPPVMLQNDQVVRAYSRWSMDVVNLGRYDLIYAQKLLAREGLAQRTSELPVIKNVISANGVFGADAAAPRAYLIKEVTGPRIKGKRRKIRVGFVGLAEPKRMSEGLDGTVKDMFETARRVVPQARKECDLLVIVAHAEWPTAIKLATENPEADVVIAGNTSGLYNPRQVGGTTVVNAAPGNTQQGDLRVYMDASGKLSVKFRTTDLDSKVPADPAASDYVETARQEMNRFRHR